MAKASENFDHQEWKFEKALTKAIIGLLTPAAVLYRH